MKYDTNLKRYINIMKFQSKTWHQCPDCHIIFEDKDLYNNHIEQ